MVGGFVVSGRRVKGFSDGGSRVGNTDLCTAPLEQHSV